MGRVRGSAFALRRSRRATGIEVAALPGQRDGLLPEALGAELSAAGMFVFIGAKPRTEWLDGDVSRDERGFVVTGTAVSADRWPLERDPFLLESSMPGVFAVGDVRARSVKRIASAVGEGSIAVQLVHEILHGTDLR
ncbi:MAG TPA: FAD-dependent oxidoreductase [Actinomycetales bacterium]|nr:FAD-dependent oxidoreductase [Actinomycetales bacterium]